MRNALLLSSTILAFLSAPAALAQVLPTDCRPSPDGLSTICDLVERISEADLATRPFIDAATFATAGNMGWSRNDVELEGATSVTCVDGNDLLGLLRAERGGRTTYQRLRRAEAMEAFTVDYGIDEMPWDNGSHALRESSPNVWLTIEDGRFEPDPANGGRRRISVGTDIMDDIYYDTADFKLLDNDMSLRARARWDSPTEIRRLLVAAKFGSSIDEWGLKRAAKIDVRNDGASAEDIAGLDLAARTGFESWDGDRSAIPAVKEVYERLAKAGKLSDVGSHDDVLLLDPKAYLRSTRSRFHLNEADIRSVQTLFTTGGKGRLDGVLAQIASARAAGAIAPNREAAVAAFETKVIGILEGTGVAARAADALKKIDPTMTVDATTIAPFLPGSATRPANATDLAKSKAVTDAVNALYHETARDLDGVRRDITASNDRALENEPAKFVAFLKSEKPDELGRITTYDKFESMYSDIAKLPDTDRATRLAAYNTWGAAQKAGGNNDFRNWNPLDADGFANLGPQMTNEKVRLWQRQLESAGSAANGLWFDKARAFYVPSSRRNTGNFLIDTMDMTEMYSPEAWSSIPAAERTAANTLPAGKAFDAVLVNELQIELGLEEPYLNRMTELGATIAKDRASIFLRYATDASLAATNDAAGYRALMASLRGKFAAELADTVTALNEFAVAQGSMIDPFTATSLKALANADLTQEIRDRAVRKDREAENALAGARFVFQQYRDQLKNMAAVKGERVLRQLRDAGGPACMEWKEIDKSKGDRALETLKEKAIHPENS